MRALLLSASIFGLLALPLSQPQAAPTSPSVPATTTAKPAASNPNSAPDGADPRDFLADIHGDKAMKWVKAHNETTMARLESDPRFRTFHDQMIEIFEAADRIAPPTFASNGAIDNFWQDGQHLQGYWRRAPLATYTAGKPKWETILDIDALNKAEGKSWIYEGSDCLPPENRLCLVRLSENGGDAVTIREFDIKTKAFVTGGFDLSGGKQTARWVDKDTLYVTREWTAGQVTQSGYAYITKRLKRHQSLAQAEEIFRGEVTDTSAERQPIRAADGTYLLDTTLREVDAYHTLQTFISGGHSVELPVPTTAIFNGVYKGQTIYSLREPWTTPGGQVFQAGSVVAFDLQSALAAPAQLKPTIVFQPDAHQSVEGVYQTKSTLVLLTLSNVSGEIRSSTFENNHWATKTLPLPANSTLRIQSADTNSDRLFVFAEGFIQPSTLYLTNALTGKTQAVSHSTARFDASNLQVEQRWVTSSDGTKVPYFLVHRKDLPLDGSTPTIINAYGGFEVAMQPMYQAQIGKLWLDHGGAYVLANIRGGGEFGPKWHEAGLKTKRQTIYDDFQAVALDLISSGITSPRRLGIVGGSNGGLLMGVQMTQRPDLWNAVIMNVPLLDMVQYSHMAAGASWIGEYGDPADPTEGAFLRKISPYHNVKAGTAYPEPLFETSTADDRVGPVHARKMAALFEDMGLPFYYFENTAGGHAAVANLDDVARKYAIEYTYLSQKLMDQ